MDSKAEVLYRVTNPITVEANLTIEPGVRVEFEQGTSFMVESAGALEADGTEENPIILTGTDEQPGWWDGIWIIDSRDINNIINWVVIEYGGRDAFHSTTEAANLTIGRSFNEGETPVTNSTIRYSGGNGIFIHSNSQMPDSENNTLTGNEEFPAVTSAVNAHYFDGTSSYEGNEEDAVRIEATTMDEDDVTWEALNVPYQIDGEIDIEEVQLTFEPGTLLAFEQGGGLEFNSLSSIIANGTEQNPIEFTGTEEQPGWWKGIWIRDSRSTNNVIDHVLIEFAGSEAFHSSVEPGNIVLGRSFDNADMTIVESEILNSAGYGIYVHDSSEINEDACDVNNFTGNQQRDCQVN